MSEPFILDTIHESPMRFSGALKDWEHTDNGKKPVVVSMSTKLRSIFSFGTDAKVFPYELTDKNIERVSGLFGADVILLKPTPDIKEYSSRDFNSSFYKRHLNPDESEIVKELQEDIQDLENQRNRLRRDLDEARQEEEEEQSSSNSTSSSQLECNYCHNSYSRRKWKDGDEKGEDMCPGCGQGTISSADEVSH